MRRVFRRQFQSTKQLRTKYGQVLDFNNSRKLLQKRQFRSVFWTSFSFLTKVANFKKNDSCADFFDANFEQ